MIGSTTKMNSAGFSKKPINFYQTGGSRFENFRGLMPSA